VPASGHFFGQLTPEQSALLDFVLPAPEPQFVPLQSFGLAGGLGLPELPQLMPIQSAASRIGASANDAKGRAQTKKAVAIVVRIAFI
jgi:hypothetical protein